MVELFSGEARYLSDGYRGGVRLFKLIFFDRVITEMDGNGVAKEEEGYRKIVIKKGNVSMYSRCTNVVAPATVLTEVRFR